MRRGNAYAAVAREDGPLADVGRVARVKRVCLYMRFAVPAIAGSRGGGLLVRGLADIRSAAVAIEYRDATGKRLAVLSASKESILTVASGQITLQQFSDQMSGTVDPAVLTKLAP